MKLPKSIVPKTLISQLSKIHNIPKILNHFVQKKSNIVNIINIKNFNSYKLLDYFKKFLYIVLQNDQ